MCNRYRMSAKQIELAKRYGVEPIYPEEVNYPPGELFPKKPAWIVRQSKAGPALDVMSWGFPHVVTGPTGKRIDKPVTNVRNLSSPFWRSALATPARRCLVPVTAFSEYGPG